MLAGAKEALARALAGVATAGDPGALAVLTRLLEECFLASPGSWRSPGPGAEYLRLVCGLYVARVAGTTEEQEDAFAAELCEVESRVARGEMRVIDAWIEEIKAAFADPPVTP